MATKRYRHGLAHYKPRTAATVARKKAHRPAAAPRYHGLSKPGTSRGTRQAQRVLGPVASWSAEALHLRDAALAETLGRAGYEGSGELWREYIDAHYRRAYRASRPRRTKHAPKAGGRVKVRAYTRRRPGGRS